jgi:hypothetical protein
LLRIAFSDGIAKLRVYTLKPSSRVHLGRCPKLGYYTLYLMPLNFQTLPPFLDSFSQWVRGDFEKLIVLVRPGS